MAQQRRRAATTRSASAPPCLFDSTPTRSRGASRDPQDTGAASHGSVEAKAASPSRAKAAETLARADRSSSKSAAARAPATTTSNVLELDDEHLGDDFVEGGVELSPAGDLDPGPMIPPQTQPLLQSLHSLEEYWPSGNGPRALFLDYDGTLREFENRPEQAVPTAEICALLEAINARSDLVPHIISGRDARFLGEHFERFSRFTLIAEHGFQISRAAQGEPGPRSWELWDQSGGDKNHEDWKAIMRDAMAQLVAETPGSHLEEKTSALVWHYREVQGDLATTDLLAKRHLERLGRLLEYHKVSDVRISLGHKVVEVSYRKARKGLVMRRLCEEKALYGEPFLGVLVAGDDVSDESMFGLAPQDTLTIKVGAGQTAARFRVESPSELRCFLWQRVLGEQHT